MPNDFHDVDLTCYSGGARLLIKLNRKKNGDVNPRRWMIAEKDGKFGQPAFRRERQVVRRLVHCVPEQQGGEANPVVAGRVEIAQVNNRS